MLITEAPCWIARAMPATEFAHAISFGSETLTSRMPGHTPRMPRSFLGAPATAAVSVPCPLESGKPPMDWRWAPWNSGWLTSAVASTSASSGLVAVTGGGTSLGSTIAARQAARASSGSGGGICIARARRFGSA